MKGDSLFVQGLRLYWRGYFWHAHEWWEEAWKTLPPSGERDALKGLIQLCALLIHAQKGHVRGCRKISSRVQSYLQKADSVFFLPLDPVRHELDRFVAAYSLSPSPSLKSTRNALRGLFSISAPSR